MKIYIAAQSQDDARNAARFLKELHHHDITATWLNKSFKATESYSEADRIQIAFDCVRDVQRSDVLVLLEPGSLTKVPGGKFVEVGVALGLGKRVFVVGPRANMLMWHPLCVALDDVADIPVHLMNV